MSKYGFALLLIFFPVLVFADNALSFSPPPTDYSVYFLGNLFGIVDGVLHGNGSQMMGTLFQVFNAAVLALGGIIITYTLLVSTINTAHDGEMLGQKWSSIWIPARSVMGLTLLIPKASGYCLMQIFVMWVIVQGVGAADKVWDAALGYLNRGGSIIQVKQTGTEVLIQAGGGEIAKGAQAILAGQVCMLGLQKQIQKQLELNKALQAKKLGLCFGLGSAPAAVVAFCQTNNVPDFLATVNAVSVYTQSVNNASFKIPMPNFVGNTAFDPLNGICGSITFNSLDTIKQNALRSVIQPQGAQAARPPSDGVDLSTAKMSRAIAVQQMYSDLASVAQTIVGNAPWADSSTDDPTSVSTLATGSTNGRPNASPSAILQFGFPLSNPETPCINNRQSDCTLWGPYPQGNTTLFDGTEFLAAIEDYSGVMRPTLTVIAQAGDLVANQKTREFINKASESGWLMAGSYFFNLTNLNTRANAVNRSLVDTQSGLGDSNFGLSTTEAIESAFPSPGPNQTASNCDSLSNPQSAILCQYLGGYRARADKVVALIAGTLIQATVPNLNGGLVTDVNLTTDQNASTVFGFTGNSVIYKALAQPGQNGISVIKPKPYKPENYFFQMPKIDFGCRKLGIWGKIGFCLGPVGDLLYNVILLNVFNAILVSVQVLVSRVLQVVLYIPLLTAQEIFMQGLRTISEPNVNPIVALAQMGTRYINTSLDIWMLTLAMDLAIAVVPFVGFAVMVALMSVVMPILLSWLGVMLGIGFVTSFYVPMLPYMIFTFGSIAWFLAVIEAMVAAPIVALGVTHPEGHDMFGKGEGAIMILMNVFLRPSLMIIGYIAGIAMTYISIWVINAGYNEAISFMTGNTIIASSPNDISVNTLGKPVAIRNKTNPGVYSGWASIYGFFMAIIIYTSMYITVVTKAFSLIAVLPDKVLRWIGGSPESAGQEAAGWSEDTKGHIKEAGDATKMGTVSAQKKLGALGGEGAEALRKKFTKGGASVKASENPGKDAS